MEFLNNGLRLFGVLFPALFLIAQTTLTLILYEVMATAFTRHQPKTGTGDCINNLCATATLTGSLQTIISLCIVGHQILLGQMQIGTTAFATLIQGFASTGFGISTALIGRTYTQYLRPKTQKKQNKKKETPDDQVEIWTY
jgi:hypothetical protein